MTPPLEFGQVAPCRACRGSGKVRGSGLDDRQRAEIIKAGGQVPTMHDCDKCAGLGYVPAAQADR